MTTTIEKNQKVPKYVQLADLLREQIASGELPPHHPLLSFTEMKAKFGATQWTVEKAHSILEEDGLIRREARRGLFVNDPSSRPKTDFVALLDYKVQRNLPYHMEVQGGLRDQAKEFEKSIILVDTPESFKHWKSMDGIVHDKFDFLRGSELAGQCPRNIPVVRLHSSEEGVSCVMADDSAGVRLAVEHLLELGHSRIGFLLRHWSSHEGPESLHITKIRYDAYCEAMEENGIERREEWANPYQTQFFDFREAGYDAMRRWLQNGWRELRLTAMLAQNDSVAAGMIDALTEAGVRVPEDVSVVGFDGAGIIMSRHRELTTVVVPLREIGAAAMKLLVAHINQPSKPPVTMKLPVTLHVGETTGPPPG